MNRKPRKDSILHNLPPEERAKVDKWLFDKGLSYAQVAEACGRFLGVKVSRSSVARYYQRRMEKEVSEKVGKRVSDPPSLKSSGAARWVGERGKQHTWEELYPQFIEGLMDAAWEAMERYEFALKHEGYTDVKEARWIVQLMKLIIAARRVEHVRTVAAGERAAMRKSFLFLVSRRRPGYGGQAGLKLGRKSGRPLARVQNVDSFAALCARWDRERERELTGGRRERW